MLWKHNCRTDANDETSQTCVNTFAGSKCQRTGAAQVEGSLSERQASRCERTCRCTSVLPVAEITDCTAFWPRSGLRHTMWTIAPRLARSCARHDIHAYAKVRRIRSLSLQCRLIAGAAPERFEAPDLGLRRSRGILCLRALCSTHCRQSTPCGCQRTSSLQEECGTISAKEMSHEGWGRDSDTGH